MQGSGLWLSYGIYFIYIASCNGLQGDVAQYITNPARNTAANPFSFREPSALWVILRNTGPTALRSFRMTKQWLSVLLKDTQKQTGEHFISNTVTCLPKWAGNVHAGIIIPNSYNMRIVSCRNVSQVETFLNPSC